jgi:transposase
MISDVYRTATTTVGIDLGDQYSAICVLDQEGDKVEEGRVRMIRTALRQRFSSMPPSRVALEVGTHSPWVSRLLGELGHEVVVANTRKLRMIYQNEGKSDRFDAEQLARVARLDPRLLHPIEHRGKQAQADLSVLRARSILVGSRTQAINHVRGALKSFGVRPMKCSAPSFARRVREVLPRELEPALRPLVEMLDELNARIRQYDRQIETLCAQRYPETQALRQVSGVGPLTALGFVLTLEDPHRFRKSRAVGAYLGLRPRQRQSGNRDPELRITKAGDRDLRSLLVQAAHYIVGPFGEDSDLRRWGLALASRGSKNAKKRAIVAVARKLAVLLHRLWVTGEEYEPLRNSRKSA